MSDILFTFEEAHIPRVVFLAAVLLIGVFALGLVYQLLTLTVL